MLVRKIIHIGGHLLIAGSVWVAMSYGAPCDSSAKDDGGIGPKQPLTVSDVIQMTRTGAGSSWDANAINTDDVVFSPDGTKFAFRTQKGDLKKDIIAYS